VPRARPRRPADAPADAPSDAPADRSADRATPHPPSGRPRVGLALAGGGPLGAIQEIGALCALQEALPALDLTRLDGYVGVSAGAFVAAGLANGMTPRALCASFIEDEAPPGDRVGPIDFLRPAWREFAHRAAALPALTLQALWRGSFGGRGWLAAAETLGRALPTGLFDHAAIERAVHRVFTRPGRSDDFRALHRATGRRLVLVATDVDSGRPAPFGRPGWDHVPISRAVAASAALPGLFPPVPIEGRWYADGALKKTLHASVLLDEGMDLLLCFNPLVPFDAGDAPARQPHGPRRHGTGTPIPPLVDGGLPVLLSQTFRSLIHSRLELGLKGYARSHPGTDILLFEPEAHDPTLFLANLFGYRERRRLAEHAYQRLRADLRSRRATLSATLARHGLALDAAVLDDPHRRLLAPPTRRRGRVAAVPVATHPEPPADDPGGAVGNGPPVPSAAQPTARCTPRPTQPATARRSGGERRRRTPATAPGRV
jgi:NTE family protein